VNIIDKSTAIKMMNTLGSKGKPFLFIIDFEMNKIIIETPDKLGSDIKVGLPNFQHNSPHVARDVCYSWQSVPMSIDAYKKGYDHVVREINLGNTFLINYTQPTPLSYSGSLLDIYDTATAKYKIWLEDKFTVFSPETFIRIIDGYVYTYPMKGTIDASLPNALDIILADEKELAEHYTIVDLLRNDLSIIAKEVSVTKFRYPDILTTQDSSLIQISSEIRGKLADDFNQRLGDHLFALLPAGSISGAPKTKTVQIIRAAEGQDRGYYTGICGYFDGRNMDSGVMIRYVEHSTEGFAYRSGCGITFQSDLNKEYQEMLQKVYIPTPPIEADGHRAPSE